ncbi:MAG: glycerol-3-phosphate dehydrogenase/oxidase, partial [Balneolaceae bacterium]
MIEKNRDQLIRELKNDKMWDVIVIGGGATGFGAALEAATRGFQTLLLERRDFGAGTSSRSTKLVHGGVRYLRQGDISLVRTALAERQRMLENAPAITRRQPFIIPVYSRWDKLFYGIGLKVYDLLAGRKNIGHSRLLSRAETIKQLPAIRDILTTDSTLPGHNASTSPRKKTLRGGILYYDGQFDDSRMIIAMLQALFRVDGRALNYVEVTGLEKDQGAMHVSGNQVSGNQVSSNRVSENQVSGNQVSGVFVKDLESGEQFRVRGRVVINATGIFADEVREMDDEMAKPMIRTSQGVHLVLDRSFHPGENAIMIPKTADGRVLFAVPWHDKVILGTTDTPVDHKDSDPMALPEEIDYLLSYAAKYLKKAPTREDVRSVYAGLRPLIDVTGRNDARGKSATTSRKPAKTSSLSRDHTLFVDPSGLITITGGKWTTWRHMGEETIDLAENALGRKSEGKKASTSSTKHL